MAVARVPMRSWSVVNNPFASGANPKIPDGATNLSVGSKYQAIRQINCPLNDELIIVVYPGLAGCVSYAGFASNDPGNVNEHNLMPNHRDHAVYKATTVGVRDTNSLQSAVLRQKENAIAKWRMVSAGLKLSLINNADENDGWWEAARVQTTNTPNDWGFYSATTPYNPDVAGDLEVYDAATGLGTYYVGPVVDKTGEGNPTESVFGIECTQLIEHPSYKTGKLRDIHKYSFNLQPNGKEHGFIKMRDEFPITVNAPDTVTKYSGTLAENASVGNNQDFVDKNVDTNYDVVIIRIHGRTSGAKTALLLHSVCNLEMVYENGTNLSRFHTPGQNAVPGPVPKPSTKKVAKRKKSTFKKTVNVVTAPMRWGTAPTRFTLKRYAKMYRGAARGFVRGK